MDIIPNGYDYEYADDAKCGGENGLHHFGIQI
jgi:hypothetical protein